MNSSKPLKFSLKELAELTNSVLQGDPDHEISGFEYLDAAENGDASFLANPRYKEALMTTRAGVVCVTQEFQGIAKSNLLISQDPSGTFQKIIEAFSSQINTKSGFKGIHPSAVIHPSAQLGAHVEIGPLAVIDEDVVIGDNTTISAHVCIGKGVKIGKDSFFYPGVIVREMCEIGNRVILQPGAVIGSCGFGYLPTKEGKHIKLAQVGIVVIEDDVEIGANTTIDRARFKETRISRGTKIDNLVQIGHNVIIGTDNIIIAQTGIAGSTKTGKHVCLAGQTGVVGHVKIGDGVIVAAKGGVSKSIDEPGKYAGVPIMPLREHNEQQVHLRNIARYVAEIKELKKKIQAIEAQI